MAVSSSATSSVTRTSYAFDTLCSGSPCCVCDANCLSKLTKNFRTPRSVAASLYKKLDEIIHEIEARRGCQLVGFSIGRAPINKRESTKRKGTYCSLDIMDPKTWNKDALKLQWEECKRSDSCGKDGLIVLSVVTEAETPINYSSHEEYVIKIEEELRSYIMFETNDNRLQITSFSLQKSKGKAHAYAIYVAMKLLESFNEVWKGGAEGSAVMHTHQYDEESKSHTKVNKLEVEEDNKELKENESELRKAVKETTQLSKSPKESHQIKVTQEESRQLKLQLSEMAELSKARETELERVKEENAQLNSQLHHNVEKIHRAKLVAEEENERLKVHLSELVERSEANDIEMRKLMEENSRLKTTNVRKSPEEKNEIKMIKKENRHLKAQVSELVKLYQVKETELNEAVTKNTLLTAQLHDVERIKEATVLEEENMQLKMQLSELIVKSEANEAELRRVMEENVQLNAKLHFSLEKREQTTTQFKRQFSNELERVEREKEKVISKLQEKLQMKDAESTIYMEDLNIERVDRERIHSQLEDLREEFAQTKERMLIERQRCEQLAEENAELSNQREKAQEDIKVLTAQVNAYSREVDKQKGLVTQSQEKHKTEVSELNEKLVNEKDKIEKMKQASMVLRGKMLESQFESNKLQEKVASLQQMLSGFQKTWKLTPKEVSISSQELGRGGWGVVWVGQLRVAVKKLHKGIVSQHNMDMFDCEIDTMSQLRHPNLVQFIGAVLDHPSGCPMIVTEVMDTSLREAYENKELTPDPGCRLVILSIMLDVAEGLSYLHCLPDPIIHRDVSSANVLLRSIGYRRWKGKISDFGSAKLAKKAITEGPGAFVYSAPEALQSIASHDPAKKQTTKMDVFSYGVLLCEIITCCFPDRVNFQCMLHQVHSISDRPSGARDTQGSLLHSLIVSCCHDDPSRRPTMKEIIEQLDIISK